MYLLDPNVVPAPGRPLVGVPLVGTQLIPNAPRRNPPFAISLQRAHKRRPYRAIPSRILKEGKKRPSQS